MAISRADDLAFRALADVSTAIAGLEARVVGGQMAGLLTTAYPTPDAVIRQTADADAAIGPEIAASGTVHELLSEAGYVPTAGNSYEKLGQRIDLLIPASGGAFTRQEVGGRGFDAAPGVRLALAVDPIEADVRVLLTDTSSLEFSTRLPPVEIAVVLKAAAYASRGAAKDLTDVHNLLHIAHQYDSTEIGGWRIAVPALSGARGDAQRTLHRIADTARRNPSLGAARVRPEVLTALIRAHIGRPVV
ncbi:hypothetical protein [Agromyces luteolus]|uniref:Nucleotidyl transferase AbiEii/AbiGii toxin family protein n=1 Tax=Agromyces luteolus TaxID=88373 RepID=A0A7C9HMS3_9MICO|nr:hypothetical protein [Agromyces luteolus]MUN08142.1 hypothetical protein [Agromyces luteolus]